MSKTNATSLLAILLACFCVIPRNCVGQTNKLDLRSALSDAANRLAMNVSTTLDTSRLDSGICLSRSDPNGSGSSTTCQNQPSNFNFLTYAQPSLGTPVLGPATVQPTVTSNTFCSSQGSNVAATCSGQTSAAQSDSVATAITKGFTTTQSISIDLDIGKIPFIDPISVSTSFSTSISEDTSTTTTTTHTDTSTAGASGGVPSLPPGQCANVIVTSVPTTQTATIPYFIGMSGGFSLWFVDSKPIPGVSTSSHFNYFLGASNIFPFIYQNQFPGLSLDGNGNLLFTGQTTVTQTTFNSTVSVQSVDCNTKQATGPVQHNVQLVKPSSPAPTGRRMLASPTKAALY